MSARLSPKQTATKGLVQSANGEGKEKRKESRERRAENQIKVCTWLSTRTDQKQHLTRVSQEQEGKGQRAEAWSEQLGRAL